MTYGAFLFACNDEMMPTVHSKSENERENENERKNS